MPEEPNTSETNEETAADGAQPAAEPISNESDTPAPSANDAADGQEQLIAGASEPQAEDAAIGADSIPGPIGAAESFAAPEFDQPSQGASLGTIDLLDDVELGVRIELGRAEMYIEDVLKLSVGSVIALDKLAGDPVDILVNGRLVARGEVLVLNDNFCVRVHDIINPIPELAESK